MTLLSSYPAFYFDESASGLFLGGLLSSRARFRLTG